MISQKTRSTLTIVIGTVIVTIGTLLLVMFASGYTFDIFQGRILTTALVLLNTNPGGATITINGKTLSQKTPYRLEGVETGELTVDYSRQDYRNWHSPYFVRAGEVTFADYALLIPNKIEPKKLSTPVVMNTIIHSEDRSKLATVSASPVAIWELTSGEQFNKIFTPGTINGHQPVAIEQTRFSPDASQILCTIRLDDGTSVVGMVSYPSGQFVNLTDTFKIPLGQLEFNPQNAHELYSLNNGVLRRLNTDSKTDTQLQIGNISSFVLERDRVYTLENNPLPATSQILVSYDQSGNNRYVLAEFPKFEQAGSLKATRLRGTNFITVLNQTNNSLTLVKREADKVETSVIGTAVHAQSFSQSGRFFTYAQANKLHTIDLEFYEHFQSNLDATSVNAFQWLTDYQYTLKTSDGLHIIDYNGQNDYTIPPQATNLSFVYGSSKDEKKITYLVDSEMFVYSLQPKGGLINFR